MSILDDLLQRAHLSGHFLSRSHGVGVGETRLSVRSGCFSFALIAVHRKAPVSPLHRLSVPDAN